MLLLEMKSFISCIAREMWSCIVNCVVFQERGSHRLLERDDASTCTVPRTSLIIEIWQKKTVTICEVPGFNV